jgi:hypothetical protein
LATKSASLNLLDSFALTTSRNDSTLTSQFE